jgi:hypothetical protein
MKFVFYVLLFAFSSIGWTQDKQQTSLSMSFHYGKVDVFPLSLMDVFINELRLKARLEWVFGLPFCKGDCFFNFLLALALMCYRMFQKSYRSPQ